MIGNRLNEKGNNRMKKHDKILILVVLIFACIGGGIFYMNRSQGAYVLVTVGTVEYGRYYLNEDQTVAINDTNLLVIRDGEAMMTAAKCPDQLCVHMASISRENEMIVCLPNQVIVEVYEE